jgi:ADP-heptose:LPS heptosyltransferase/glycosyltransferase involved in cell wall biosynthesis
MTAGTAHVVVDARMANDGGIGTYLRQLLPRIARSRPEWRFTLLGDPSALSAMQAEHVSVRACGAPIYGVREQIEVPLQVPADASVFWAPHYHFPVLLRRSCRLVVTVHDVAHLALPQGSLLKQGYARAMFSQVASRADAILFDSEFSRHEMARFVASRGTNAVAPLGVDESWFAADSASSRPLDDPYIVYVGNWKRHKNIPALLRAFGRVRKKIPHRLVLIGRRDGLNIDKTIDGEMAALGDRVLHVGEIDDAQLRRWVSHADALVTTSLYEGFGLPPLEAMAAGCPTVVSNAGSLPEICGDATLYVDPRDETDIAARIVEVLTDAELRGQLIERGRARARGFTWEQCAATTVGVLERAMEGTTARSPLRGRYLVSNPAWNWWLRLNDFGVRMMNGRHADASDATRASTAHPTKRVLLAIGGHLGDGVIATAMFRQVSESFPDAEIGVLCASWNRRIFELHPRVRWIHTVDHWKLNRGRSSLIDRWRTTRSTRAQALAEIRSTKYDVAVDLSPYYPNAARLLWRAGIPVRVGYTSGGDGPLFTHPVSWSMRDHVSEEHRALLAQVGPFTQRDPAAYELADVPTESVTRANEILRGGGLAPGNYVVVHMGAGHARKEWPVEKWIVVVRELAAVGVRCALTGAGPQQMRLAQQLAAAVSGTVNLSDQLDWNQFRAVIAGARLVLSVDTVAMHLAGAAGRPCVSLMTGMDRTERWRALGAEVTVLSEPVSCAPCFRSRGCAKMSCVRDITPTSVIAASRPYLNGVLQK